MHYTPKATDTGSSHKSGSSGKTLKIIIPVDTQISQEIPETGPEKQCDGNGEVEGSKKPEGKEGSEEPCPTSVYRNKEKNTPEDENENGEMNIPGFEAPFAILGIFLVLRTGKRYKKKGKKE